MNNFLSDEQLDILLAEFPQAQLPTGFVDGVMAQLPEAQDMAIPTADLEFRLQWIDFFLPIGVTLMVIIFSSLAGQDFSPLFGWFDQTAVPLLSGQPLPSNWVSLTVLLALLQIAVFGTLAWYWLDDDGSHAIELAR